jgi:4-diphosphocytidyl-2-C-methyl-D-erythritol kinase
VTGSTQAGAAALELDATAKVNLTLAVTGRRADGYHELASVFVRLALADRLAIIPRDTRSAGDALAVDGDPACPIEGNLVLRAAAVLREHTPRALPGLAFHLHKRIPIAAGLAGGSSDAAAALALAATAWDLELDAGHRARLALRLGADVPFFVVDAPTAIVGGVGELVTPLRAVVGGAGVLLVTPPYRLSTAAVFAAFDDVRRHVTGASGMTLHIAQRLGAGLTGRDLAALAVDLRDANDLWSAATRVAPPLAALRAALESVLGRPALLTGSGSTLVTLYPSAQGARDARADLIMAAPPAITDCRILATHTVESLGSETPA